MVILGGSVSAHIMRRFAVAGSRQGTVLALLMVFSCVVSLGVVQRAGPLGILCSITLQALEDVLTIRVGVMPFRNGAY